MTGGRTGTLPFVSSWTYLRYSLSFRTSCPVNVSVLFPQSSSLARVARNLTAFIPGSASLFPKAPVRYRLVAKPFLFSSHHEKRVVSLTFASTTEPTPSDTSSPTSPLEQAKDLVRIKTKSGAYRQVYNILLASQEPGSGVVPDAELCRLVIRALIKGNRPKLAKEAFELREKLRLERSDLEVDVSLAAGVVRGLVRIKDWEGIKPVFAAVLKDCNQLKLREGSEGDGKIANAMAGLAGMTASVLKGEEIKLAVQGVDCMRNVAERTGRCAPLRACNDLIRLFGKKRRLREVFQVVDAMKVGNIDLSSETYEFLANAAVRDVEFVTGAVSMNTLPEPMCPEIAFVGRSNVGKSSLVNMMCNRRALAHISGRPGKTQQFNYFLVNSREVGTRFYLVDLPGVGYAEVPRDVQAQWLEFMVQYIDRRRTLQVILHLIDSRHGPKGDDEDLMDLIANSRCTAIYVVVLTKIDKLEKRKVKRAVIDATRNALTRNGLPGETPLVLTSASTKEGRDQLWNYLRIIIPSLNPQPSRNK